MTEILQVVSAAGDAGTAVMGLIMLWQHHRTARIERHLWPDVFGN